MKIFKESIYRNPKKEKKKRQKIRKWLYKEYHLCEGVEFDYKGETVIQWKLYKKYDDPKIYYSSDNKAIMTSDDYTLDELYNFAKNHYKIEEGTITAFANVIMGWILIIILGINIVVIKDQKLAGVILGANIIIIIESIIKAIILGHNTKVDQLMWKERIENLRRKER